MVKGVTRQVVVVRSPDPELFEQAIFIVRGDGAHTITEEEVLRQARRAAGGYVTSRVGGARASGSIWPRIAFAALGAALTGLLWALTVLL